MINKYIKAISKIKNEIFKELPMSRTSTNKLKLIAGYLFVKDKFSNSVSGIVVAGFGEHEFFPSLISYIMEGIVNNSLKFKQEHCQRIDFNNVATVIPFAQSEMVSTFMEGIDPRYRTITDAWLKKLFDELPDYYTGAIGEIADNTKTEITQKLKELGANILRKFRRELENYQEKVYISPITHAVAVLPKDELAAMAESLVNLTSLKRKVSTDSETVGGPIDVAVISKGDGFIWIRRKHYFKPDCNHHFFSNYYRNCGEGNE